MKMKKEGVRFELTFFCRKRVFPSEIDLFVLLFLVFVFIFFICSTGKRESSFETSVVGFLETECREGRGRGSNPQEFVWWGEGGRKNDTILQILARAYT